MVDAGAVVPGKEASLVGASPPYPAGLPVAPRLFPWNPPSVEELAPGEQACTEHPDCSFRGEWGDFIFGGWDRFL